MVSFAEQEFFNCEAQKFQNEYQPTPRPALPEDVQNKKCLINTFIVDCLYTKGKCDKIGRCFNQEFIYLKHHTKSKTDKAAL